MQEEQSTEQHENPSREGEFVDITLLETADGDDCDNPLQGCCGFLP